MADGMTYEIVDMDCGDVLAVYDVLDAAEHRLRALARKHPNLVGDIAIVPLDERGARAREPLFLSDLGVRA